MAVVKASTDFDDDQLSYPQLFLQWKGIEICADFWCSCGKSAHVCGEMFVYRIQCGSCGKVFALPSTVELVEVADDDPTVTKRLTTEDMDD